MLAEAMVYRAGSWLLSTILLYTMTGHIQFATMMGIILVGFHTAYYIAFRHFWRWYRRGWKEVDCL